MLTAALDGLIDRFGLAGERLGEVAGGAVLKHSPRPRPDPRVRARHAASPPETPAYDVQQACGTGLETTILVANKIALGQIDVRHRLRRRHHLRRADRAQRGPARDRCSRPTAQRSTAGKLRALTAAPPRPASSPRSPATRSRAPASRWASTARSWPSEWEIDPRRAGRARRSPATSNLAAAYERGFLDDLITPYLGPRARPEPAPGLQRREAGEAEAGLRRRGRAR